MAGRADTDFYDRPPRPPAEVLPPFRRRPIASLKSRRVALIGARERACR
jgi:hypothetical protein